MSIPCGIYAEACGDMERYAEGLWAVMSSKSSMAFRGVQGDVGRCREMRGDIGGQVERVDDGLGRADTALPADITAFDVTLESLVPLPDDPSAPRRRRGHNARRKRDALFFTTGHRVRGRGQILVARKATPGDFEFALFGNSPGDQLAIDVYVRRACLNRKLRNSRFVLFRLTQSF